MCFAWKILISYIGKLPSSLVGHIWDGNTCNWVPMPRLLVDRRFRDLPVCNTSSFSTFRKLFIYFFSVTQRVPAIGDGSVLPVCHEHFTARCGLANRSFATQSVFNSLCKNHETIPNYSLPNISKSSNAVPNFAQTAVIRKTLDGHTDQTHAISSTLVLWSFVSLLDSSKRAQMFVTYRDALHIFVSIARI